MPVNGDSTLTVEAAHRKFFPCLKPGLDRGLKDGGVAAENVNMGLEMKGKDFQEE